MKKINQLKAGALLSYAHIGINNCISILYTPIMLRLLGQAEYGLYNLSNSIIGYLGVLDFGLGNTIVRYTAKYRANDDKEGLSNLNGVFFIVYSMIAFIASLVGIALIFNIENIFSNSLTGTELYKMKVLMCLMVFNLALSLPGGIFGAIITAYEEFIFQKLLGIIKAILSPMVMLPMLLMGYKSVGIAVISTIINILYISVSMYYCFKKIGLKVKFRNLDFSILKDILGYSVFIFVNMILDKIYWTTDQFILGATSGTVTVAIYAIGINFNNYFKDFSTAISGVFLPKVTLMVEKNTTNKELSDLFIRIGRIQFIVLSFILGAFFLVGKNFIICWAGADYEEAYVIALIVMVSLIIPMIQNTGITILQAKNIQKFKTWEYIITSLVKLIVSIYISKLFGGIGCALVTSITLFLGEVVMNFYYQKRIKIDIIDFWKNIFKMSIPVIISIGITSMINQFILIEGILAIIVLGLEFSFLFIVLMWIMAMNDEEKNLVLKPVKKIFNKLTEVKLSR